MGSNYDSNGSSNFIYDSTFWFSLFYLRGVAPKEVTTIDIYKGVIPFVLIQLVAIIIVFLIPEIATMIPSLI